MKIRRLSWPTLFTLIIWPCILDATENPPAHVDQWRHYGGDLAGSRYAQQVDISPDNVAELRESWVFQTGDIANGTDYFGRVSAFKATAIYVDNKLVVSSGFNPVYALNPSDGELLWRAG
jgi:quinoprotein glucose dehydrogenase